MVDFPANLDKIRELPLEPKVRELLTNRLPAELVLLASIAISLRKIARDKDDD